MKILNVGFTFTAIRPQLALERAFRIEATADA
jgi:hypothetical protein